jgi:hypothetical protein
MFTGFVVMFLSTLMFAFGSSYGTLWLARALQGVGSACTSTSGKWFLIVKEEGTKRKNSSNFVWIVYFRLLEFLIFRLNFELRIYSNLVIVHKSRNFSLFSIKISFNFRFTFLNSFDL